MIFHNSIKKNYIMSATLTIANFLFPLITYPYISRTLLPEGTGTVAFASSIMAYFFMFAQLGVPMYGVRACARVRDNNNELSKTVQELLFINAVTTLVSCIILGMCVLLIPKLYSERTLYLVLSISIILQSISMEWFFKAIEKYSYITKRSLLFKFISIIAIFLLIHQQSDYIIYAGITVFSSSASYVLNFLYARRLIDLRQIHKLDWKRHIKGVLIFFAMYCASTIYVNLDVVMLGFLQGDKAVGLYNTALKIRIMLLSLVTSLGTVILPRASYYIEQKKIDEFWNMIKKSISFVFLLSIPLTIYFVFFARPSILLLAGDAYSKSILPMQIIIPTLFLVGISNVTGIQVLIPLGKERVVLHSMIVGAIVNFILNYLFINKYGPAGAACTTLIAEIFVLVVQLIALKDRLSYFLSGLNYIDYIIAIVISIMGSLWIYLLDLDYFPTLAISACLFFGIFYSYLYYRKQPLIIEIISNVLVAIRRNTERNVKKNA